MTANAILRTALFVMIVKMSCLLELKLKTQVLDNGRICILGVDKSDMEKLRLKIVPDNVLTKGHDSQVTIDSNSVLLDRQKKQLGGIWKVARSQLNDSVGDLTTD